MQAECFAGVFYRATLDSVDPGITWSQWINAVRQAGESKVHGKPRNLAYWQDRGFDGASARYCNTWTAPGAASGWPERVPALASTSSGSASTWEKASSAAPTRVASSASAEVRSRSRSRGGPGRAAPSRLRTWAAEPR